MKKLDIAKIWYDYVMMVVVVKPSKSKPVTSHRRQVKIVGTPKIGGLAIVIVVIVGIDSGIIVGKIDRKWINKIVGTIVIEMLCDIDTTTNTNYHNTQLM